MFRLKRRLKLFISYSVLATVSLFSNPSHIVFAVAFDEGFYSGNDIMLYDPRDQGCLTDAISGGDALEGNDNLEKVMRFFVEQGFTLEQAAGIAGNIRAESSFDPGVEEKTARTSKGYGLAQWTFGRRTALENAAKAQGVPSNDISFQLNFLLDEMKKRKPNLLSKVNTGNRYGKYSNEYSIMRAQTSVSDALIAFHHNFERSHLLNGSNPDAAVKNARGGFADTYFNKFKGVITTTATPAIGDSETGDTISTPTVASCSGEEASSAEFLDDGMVIYNQEDPRWSNKKFGSSTIGPSGCAPTSLATIITKMTGQSVTPDVVAEYAGSKGMYINGQGASHAIANVVAPKWNLKATKVSKNVSSINKELRSGKMVVMAGQGAAPFTASGHYIAIRGVLANGKWKIADSNGIKGQENSKKEWDPNAILATDVRESSIYAISK